MNKNRSLSAVLLLPLVLPIQGDELPPGSVAQVNGRLITLDAYKDYLFAVTGLRPLNDMISTMLLEEEALKYDVTVTDVEIEEKLRSHMADYREKRHKGDQVSLDRELAAQGFDEAGYMAKLRIEFRRDLLQERLVLLTRVVTDEQKERFFERRYGIGGEKVVVRHCWVSPNRLVNEAVRSGTPAREVDRAAMEIQAEKTIRESRSRIMGGEDFAAVVQQQSHDLATRDKGGVIPDYNYMHYGDVFAGQVRSLETGTVSEPFKTPAGWHVVRVDSRTTTTLEDVVDEIVEELLAQPPSWQEKSSLIQHLQEQAIIQR